MSNNSEVKGIKVKTLSKVLVFWEVLFVAMSIICAADLITKYNNVNRLNDEYAKMQEDIYQITKSSDYLTAKSRLYIINGDEKSLSEYIEEFFNAKSREAALESVHMEISDLGAPEYNYLDFALEKSDELAGLELHAMALAYSVYNNTDILPPELSDYNLSEEEKRMTADEKLAFANKLVFSERYSVIKLNIMEIIDVASQQLLTIVRNRVEKSSFDYRVMSAVMISLLSVCGIIFMAIVFALAKYILKPIDRSIHSIEKDQKIEYSKGYEINYLAHAFNTLYEKNTQTRLRLKATAERDNLTGLLNREGYEEIKKNYLSNNEPLALIILDADNFKTINDGFGHEAGDKSLQRIARLLMQSFRESDYIVRYGGDEFLVIMTGAGSQNRKVVENKLTYLNKVLISEHSLEGPKLSLSIGAAFSEKGYTEELFKQADNALYQAKENGKGGFVLYNP